MLKVNPKRNIILLPPIHDKELRLNGLRSSVRCSSLAMSVIASMMPAHDLLIPGFRDVIGVNYALRLRVKTGEYNELLLSAAKKGHTDVVMVLLNAGANTDVKGWNDWTPLHWAVKNGRTDIVKLLLMRGRTRK